MLHALFNTKKIDTLNFLKNGIPQLTDVNEQTALITQIGKL